jgi:hypothetical protein
VSASGTAVTIDMGASMETEEGLAIIDALNEVSDVQAMAGREVTFIGQRRASVAPLSHLADQAQLEGADIYECPRGWVILFRVAEGPSWCVAGERLEEALDDIEDEDLQDALREEASGAGLL